MIYLSTIRFDRGVRTRRVGDFTFHEKKKNNDSNIAE